MGDLRLSIMLAIACERLYGVGDLLLITLPSSQTSLLVQVGLRVEHSNLHQDSSRGMYKLG